VLAESIPQSRPDTTLAVLERLHRDLVMLEKTRRRVNNLIMRAELRIGTMELQR
jgi:hypothetical protein